MSIKAPAVPTGILVVGMHRSGTSAATGTLQMLGIELGKDLLEPGPDNPKGYWELRSAVEINERLLRQLDRDWDDIRALPEGWMKSLAAKEAMESIEALVFREFAGAPVWAVKDPRISRLLPVWTEALSRTQTRPAVLFVARHPLEVAASIQHRNGWSAPVSDILWARHLLEAEEASRGLDRAAVTYEAVLAEPAKAVSAALAKLGVVTTAAPEALREFVDAKDRHHDEFGKCNIGTRLSAINGAAYEALKRIAAGETDWGSIQSSAKAFRSEWLKWGAYADATAAMSAAFKAETHAANVRISQIQSDLFAQIRWSDAAASQNQSLEHERAELQLALASKSAKKGDLLDKIRELEADLAYSDYALNAQLRWSDEMVMRWEALYAECAQLRSDLTAQIDWSNAAAGRHDLLEEVRKKLQAERDGLQVERDELRVECAQLRSDLTAQTDWLNAVIGKHEEREAEHERIQAEAHVLHRDMAGACAKLESVLESLETELDTTKLALARMAGELAVVLGSRSWRFTQFFRSLAKTFRPSSGR